MIIIFFYLIQVRLVYTYWIFKYQNILTQITRTRLTRIVIYGQP